METSEIDRFFMADLGPQLPGARWEGIVDLGQDHDVRWRMILDVVLKLISEHHESWPEDSEWEIMLPGWLASFMLTDQQADELLEKTPREEWENLPWHFPSWLDAIKERGWCWSGCQRFGQEARIVLEIVSIPPRIDAFKQILLAAGAMLSSEIFYD